MPGAGPGPGPWIGCAARGRARSARRAPGSGAATSKAGYSPVSPAGAGATSTRRSYQAAWPVTGSEFDSGFAPAARGSSSAIRWFMRNPSVPSGASGSSPQVPRCLPIAFQVQTVSGLQPSISLARQRIQPWRLDTRTQDRSSIPSASPRARFMYRKLLAMIWRSHAFCESHEWYMNIGRCVTAWNGKPSPPTASRPAFASSSAGYQSGSGEKYVFRRSRSASAGGYGPGPLPSAASSKRRSVSEYTSMTTGPSRSVNPTLLAHSR